MAAAFYKETWTEQNFIPAMVQSKVKIHKILSQPCDISEIVDKTQISAAKQARFVIHSSKRKGRTLYFINFVPLNVYNVYVYAN